MYLQYLLRKFKLWFIEIYGLNLWKNKPGVWPNAWGRFRIIIPGQKIFFTPALYHDLSYSLWGNELDKNRADINFYKWCLEISKNRFQKKLATIYFYSLKIFWLFCFTRK